MSNTTTPSVGAVHPDLQRERRQATFDPVRLTHLLDGSASLTARRHQLQRLIERDPTGVFSNDNNLYLHRTQRHVRALAKHVRLVELARTLKLGEESSSSSTYAPIPGEITASPDFATLVASTADDLPTALHWIMFLPNIYSLCDDAQQREWLPLCRDWRVIGCYAQTELGHGSNVRALETTATYQSPAQGGGPDGCFVVHSPTRTATKFWPGTLGRTANTAMVIARLIDGSGVDQGVHNFIVPLRSRTDHTLLPGVTTGDLGPKIGYNTMDNGYLQLTRVRIPRRNMAMRFATVDTSGRYRKTSTAATAAASKIAYITMMQVRAHICNEAGKNLGVACTIAIRYSAVRRQGYVNEDRSTTNNKKDNTSAAAIANSRPAERQVLDYTQQQHRLLPLLASSYCFFFTGKKVLMQLRDIERRVATQGATSRSTTTEQSVTKTQVTDIHASSSALKSFTTTVAADGIEDCRKACGGHGFLQCSGLPELLTTYLQNPTVEGDNQMLPQQVIKVLLKLVHVVHRAGGSDDVTTAQLLAEYEPCDSFRLVPFLRTMVPDDRSEACKARSAKDLLDLTVLRDAFGHRAARVLVGVATLMMETKQSQPQQKHNDGGADSNETNDAWNGALVEMGRASRAYAQCLLLNNFVEGIADAQNDSRTPMGPAEVQVLCDLARLWALYWMEHDMGDFMEDGFLSRMQSQWVRANVRHLLSVVRPNAVALVDARDFSDFRLKSALGRFDGDVYPAILKAAQGDPLNKTEPGPGYQEHLSRLIAGGAGQYTGTASRL